MLNFDVSVHHQNQAAAGFVVGDASSHPVLAMTKNLGMVEILVVEAMALRDGLLAIPNPVNMHLCVEGDSKVLIDAVNGEIAMYTLENQVFCS